MEKIKLNQLEMLVAAADAGSFSAAAADLGCTQSRISVEDHPDRTWRILA